MMRAEVTTQTEEMEVVMVIKPVEVTSYLQPFKIHVVEYREIQEVIHNGTNYQLNFNTIKGKICY